MQPQMELREGEPTESRIVECFQAFTLQAENWGRPQGGTDFPLAKRDSGFNRLTFTWGHLWHVPTIVLPPEAGSMECLPFLGPDDMRV